MDKENTPKTTFRAGRIGRVIWVGPVFEDSWVHRYKAVSPAGNKWQKCLLASLLKFGNDIAAVGHIPAQPFPFGSLLFRSERHSILDSFKIDLLPYCNLPSLRDYIIRYNVKKWIDANWCDDAVVLTYNLPWHLQWLCSSRYAPRCFPIIADIESEKEFKLLEKKASYVGGCVSLSWGLKKRWNHLNVHHLDGGVGVRPLTPPRIVENRIPVVAYTGSLARHGGVELLLKSLRFLPPSCCEIWITGKGDWERLRALVPKHIGVKYHGLLLNNELSSLCSNVDIFVNPRDLTIVANDFNFPSKILEYVVWGKPIVSTRASGLSPTYNDFLIYAGNSPEEFAQGIGCALRKCAVDREAIKVASTRFCTENTWDSQASQLLSWLHRSV